jgi:PAS domain S-box-containing protein
MPSQTTGFDGLLEAVPDALVGVDMAGVIRLANHQTEPLFGYSHDDMVGAPSRPCCRSLYARSTRSTGQPTTRRRELGVWK